MVARNGVGTLEQAIEVFIEASEAELKSWKTIYGYRDALKLFLQFCGNIPLEELNDGHLRSFIANEAGRRREVNCELVPYSSEIIYKRYKVVKSLLASLSMV